MGLASMSLTSKLIIGMLVGLASAEAKASVPYLLDVVVSSESRKVELSEVIDEISKANLISIGETHDHGIEREHIRDLYAAMAPRLAMQPECFAESFPSLVPSNSVVYPMITSVCKSITSIMGDGHGFINFFAQPSLAAFERGLVLTQSGLHHVMPMGLYFPGDFTPSYIDTKKNNISSQIPKKYLKTTKMVSVSFQDIDNLSVTMLNYELKQVIVETYKTKFKNSDAKKQFIAAKLVDIEARIRASFEKLNAEFSTPGQVNYYKVASLQSKAKPNRVSFMALYSKSIYAASVMTTLLRSQELIDFISIFAATFTPNVSFLIVKIVDSDQGDLYSDFTINKSGIYIFNDAGSAIVSQPSGVVELKLK